MNIHVTLNPKSIQDAIDKLRKYRDDLPKKLREFELRLADIGLFVMRRMYDGAADYAGDNDVDVSISIIDDKVTICADSKNGVVGFIEFGTGVNYPEAPHTMWLDVPPHGSYGQHRGATGKVWIYDGRPGTRGTPSKIAPGKYITDGNPPTNAMPRAMEAMRDQIVKIAEEVFGSD